MTKEEKKKALDEGKIVIRVSYNGRRNRWMIAMLNSDGSGWTYRFNNEEFESYEKAWIYANEYVENHEGKPEIILES